MEIEDKSWLQNRYDKFDQEIKQSFLPIIIKDRISLIASLTCILIEGYKSGWSKRKHQLHHWESLIKELWEAFKSITISKKKTENLSLQEEIKIIEAMGKLIYREFSNISESNANILTERLDSIQRDVRGHIILDQICKNFLLHIDP
jgi:DNA-directed RNA polymerase beta' subunit